MNRERDNASEAEAQPEPTRPEPSRDSWLPKYIEDLLTGNLGLAMTYWVYGVLAGFVWGAALTTLQPEYDFQRTDVNRFAEYAFIGYYILIYVAIWNAASKYKGSKVWSVLAKFVLVLTATPLLITLFKLATKAA